MGLIGERGDGTTRNEGRLSGENLDSQNCTVYSRNVIKTSACHWDPRLSRIIPCCCVPSRIGSVPRPLRVFQALRLRPRGRGFSTRLGGGWSGPANTDPRG